MFASIKFFALINSMPIFDLFRQKKSHDGLFKKTKIVYPTPNNTKVASTINATAKQ